jgi:spore coat protein H
MKRHSITSKSLIYLLLQVLFQGVYPTLAYSQPFPAENLNLSDSGKTIENSISLYLTELQLDALSATTGEKIDITTGTVVINGDTIKPEEISTRGQTTLMFKRKSLGFKLKSQAVIHHGYKTDSLKKFSLLNLAMDQYYCRNRIAFEMMEEIGIFDLFYSFCDLKINGKSEGVFMIIEPPEDWAIRKEKSPLVLRRGYNHQIEKTKSGKKSDRDDIKKYLKQYRQIYKDLNKFESEELYTALSEYIDLDSYMKWLAFNFIVRNGDYSDEVFFYIDPEIKKYRIIPWDYDDIFASAPHEGSLQRNKALGDKLIFSSEDDLDKKIASDPYLYKIYLTMFKEVLEKLSPELLKRVFENTYAELYPFFSNKEIISNSEFDVYKDANMDNLKSYLLTIYLQEKAYRDKHREYLENKNK